MCSIESYRWFRSILDAKRSHQLLGFVQLVFEFPVFEQRLLEPVRLRVGRGVLRFDWDMRIVEPLRRKQPLPDLWALYRSLRDIPLLAIRGGVSDVLSQAAFDRMAVEHPGLQRLCLDGVGHVPSLTEPESTEALDRFLAKL